MKNKLTPKICAQILVQLAKDCESNNIELIVDTYIHFLKSNNKLYLMHKTLVEVDKIVFESDSEKKLIIELKNKLSDQNIHKIQQIFGDNVLIEEKIDPEIIAGVRIITDEKIFDTTMNTQLKSLKRHMNN
jgi:F0F1-type ATP synthase delta subunit